MARWCGWAATRCQRTSRRTLPLGSTDMGNVTQVMPGIHPIVGIEADGASIHQPAFTAAAAGPSADKAVVEGAIMLARTVVSLAETPAERDRVLELRGETAERVGMSLADAAELWLDAHYDDLVAWRRHIHAHPELGRQEFATTQFVASHLADAGLNPKVLPGGTGLTCDFGPEHGPRIALRADMDALPMAERTGAPYASVVPNVAHACGHDAHTAVLLGAALALASVPELPVGVRLIFQAAEELMPGGAIDAIAAGALTGVSRIFALHCDPRLAVGKVALRAGPITSAADQLEVTLQSHGGHTSRPHLTGDLVYGLGTLITGRARCAVAPHRPAQQHGDGVGCGQCGCRRQRDPADRHTGRDHPHGQPRHLGSLEAIVREIVSSLLAAAGHRAQLQYRRGVPPVVNEEISTRILTHAIEAIGPDVLCDTRQSGGGEDFSWYLEEVPGAMARLGVWTGRGPQLDLHQPTFDLDERSLAVGVRVLVNIVDQAAQF